MRAVFIVAEAGVNHNGSLDLAKELVFNAKRAGADAVKFQTFISQSLVSPSAKLGAYQKAGIDYSINSQVEMLKPLEFSEEKFADLYSYCKSVGIEFMSTAFEENSFELLKRLGVTRFKIPSGEITNKSLVLRIAESDGEILMSTGMSYLNEVETAIEWINDVRSDLNNVCILHCTSAYPAPNKSLNLNSIQTLKNHFGLKVGYSDHSLTGTASIAAVALGATVIEKHLTIDKNLDGPDHSMSMTPDQLTAMIGAIRELELQLGSYEKKPAEEEMANRDLFRKSIHTLAPVRKGEQFSYKNLGVMRPGDGINASRLDEYIGKLSTRDYKKFEKIR